MLGYFLFDALVKVHALEGHLGFYYTQCLGGMVPEQWSPSMVYGRLRND